MAASRSANQGRSSQIFEIIAEEIGISIEELEDDAYFADLGVDNFLSKSIISKVSEILDIDLPDTAFQDYPSVQDLRQYLQQENRAESRSKSITLPPASVAHVPLPATGKAKSSPKTTFPLSLMLQGNASPTSKTIFLFPDGSGSGMSYAALPPISSSLCLIGLNSPFLKSAQDYTCSIEDLIAIWIPEVRKRQPHGPFILGGWSAGGYYAFEAAKQLIREGEIVEKLILIDSPCRLRYEALPMEVVKYLSASGRMGNWGSKNAPEWLVRHFESTIKAVDGYVPVPMDAGCVPETFIIWSEEGMFDDLGALEMGLDLNVKVTRFLLEGKPSFGPHGWEELVRGRRIQIARMPGNHFTLIHPPNVCICFPCAIIF